MRILLLIAPKDYSGVAAAEGNSPAAAASAAARIPVSGKSEPGQWGREGGRVHGNGMGCCRQ